MIINKGNKILIMGIQNYGSNIPFIFMNNIKAFCARIMHWKWKKLTFPSLHVEHVKRARWQLGPPKLANREVDLIVYFAHL